MSISIKNTPEVTKPQKEFTEKSRKHENKIDETIQKKHEKDTVRYQFKPNVARIMNFSGWGTEKEMKLKIQEYAKIKKLYNSENKILDLTKF